MKKIISLIVALLSVSVLSAKGDLHLFDVDNKDGSITTVQIEKAFVDAGFGIGVNSNMNKPFMIQFKKTGYKVFTLLTVYHKQMSMDLVTKYPDFGVFMPMGVGIYQSKSEDTLHVSVLTADAQAKILGFDDPLIKSIEKEVLAVLKKALPNSNNKLSEDALKADKSLVTKYELELDGEDWAESRENLMLSLNNGFDLYGFVIPSKLNVNESLKESPYDFYETISICKLPVIYTVSLTRPEAAAFAPCSLMLYKKKDEDKIVLGFPAVHNWISSAHVENKEATDVLLKAQKQFESILAEATE
ncbi:DUF302 domain-containing protein [Candidatus Sulfurimonas marisnigri]|uniref:DUF302 domain-containing protein n=1 Tax=Candidatus Sulfurimonas marisnigri TaxID=2740405 RepID=A0A7S7RQQ9_9BACT|nr:DUF302 domain-containing protein [Candidatus Sulfurimonas marisnigri]QOY54869.1 DUF302 domain-containing protein [Candidatus Sulfurimonas marisnigri]